MLAGGCLSSVGFMLTLLCTTSRAFQGVCSLGIVPGWFGKYFGHLHPRWGTPVRVIILNSVVTVILTILFDFENLVAISQVFYNLRLFCVLASAWFLRKKFPLLKRPYQVPFGKKGLCLCVCVPGLICLFTTIVSALEDPQLTLPITALIILASFFISKLWYKYGGVLQKLEQFKAQTQLQPNYSLSSSPPPILSHSRSQGLMEGREMVVMGGSGGDNIDGKVGPQDQGKVPLRINDDEDKDSNRQSQGGGSQTNVFQHS